MKNPMCDGSGPCDPGTVRLLPLGKIPDHGNLILCRCCFERELAYRRQRNNKLAKDCAFALPAWTECKVYGDEEKPSSLYGDLKAAGVPMDSHESDLYFKDTPASRAILAKWPDKATLARPFWSTLNGWELWWDVPFAFLPWWEACGSTANASN